MPPRRRRANEPLLVALVWIEAHCVIPDRDQVGQEFQLFDEQARFLKAHYLVRGAAKPGELAQAFVYRRSQVVAPQKAGKSPLEAAQTCLEAVGPALFAGWARGGEIYDCRDHGCGCGWWYEYEPGEPMGKAWPTPLIQITATSVEQTENIYDALRPMIDCGPLSDVITKTGEEFIRLPNGGRIDAVTSSAKSRLGQRVTFVPQDETGIWTKSNGMVIVAETQRRGLAGMGGRAVEITNAWNPAEGSVAQRTADSGQSDIYRQHVLPPPHLSYQNKQERHRIHVAVYKGWWGERNLSTIEAEAAELLEKDPAQAERFFGNRIVSSSDAYFDGEAWERSGLPMPVASGDRVTVGFDGSDKDARGHADETWFRCCRVSDGYLFTPRFPDGRPMRWRHPENAEASKDWQVPRGEVHAAWRHIKATFDVARMYADPPYWQSEIDEWAAEVPDVVVRWETFRTRQMAAALEQLRTDINVGEVLHDSDPEVTQHMRNATGSPRAGGTLIVKPGDEQKIDAAMATTLAYEARNDVIAAAVQEEAVDRSFTFA